MRLYATFGVVALSAFHADGARPNPRFKPPTSIEPEPSMATVRVRHVHRVVQKCTLRERAGELSCHPTLSNGDPGTELWLIPRPSPGIHQPRDDRREAVVIVVAGGNTEGTASVAVAPGAWAIDWPGYPLERRIALVSASEVAVTLQTTTGRCDRVSRACKLVAGAVSKRLDIVTP